MQEADRLKKLPPYLFTIVDNIKEEVKKQGVDVIDLSMGNPDLLPSQHILDELYDSIKISDNNMYSKSDGEVEKDLNKAIADWYKDKFNVELDSKKEVLPLIGSKEGIAHLSIAFLNPDDVAIVPSPAYPVHFNGVILAGGKLHSIPLLEENNYLADFESVEQSVVDKTKLIFLSYPNNPTGAVASKEYFQKVYDWAKDKNILVAHDAAYSEISFDGYKAPSFLEIEGAKDISIEFHSLSKTYSMAGWRIGFVVGNSEALDILKKAKSYVDFGIFRGIQHAAVKALAGSQDCVTETVNIYKERLEFFVNGLNELGWEVTMPKATFYIWAKIPEKFSNLTALEFSSLLLREVGVAAAPGTGFGEGGEGYVRFAMVDNKERLQEALKRIKTILDK
jgi:LL-diaminopimelate aminotransferase